MAHAAARHVFLIEPVEFRYNRETADTNVFQHRPPAAEEVRLSSLAVVQHRALRDLLVTHGVAVTVARSSAETPDAAFCNNWFSTHPADRDRPATLVLYPLLAPNRRIERRPDLVALLRTAYPRVVDFSEGEARSLFLESTGSLVLDHDARVAYAALSPRTDFGLASEWARTLGFDLVSFTALDANGVPYYHTNVVMFLGHGVAGICLEAIATAEERRAVEFALHAGGHEVVDLTRRQVDAYCGNCLALAGAAGEPLWLMSSRAERAFRPPQRTVLERHGRILSADLSAFEELGGGSARCLAAELF